MRAGIRFDSRIRACALTAWLVLCAAYLASTTDASGRSVTLAALLVAAMTGLLRRDWRESLAVGLASAALTAGLMRREDGVAMPVLAAAVLVLTALLAAWARPRPQKPTADTPSNDRPAVPAPAGARLPPGVADVAIFDRLAVHEMTRARRYERPLVLLLIGIDGWPTLVTERGRRGAFELLVTLAARVRRLLRDVDAIGVHGDGRLAVLLPETPLDGALVVAGRIEQTAIGEVGIKTCIGAAVFPDDAVTVEALLREAEAGLDLARLEGVGTVERIRLA